MVKDGDPVIMPVGAKHNIVKTSKKALLKLCTMYSPPEHQDKLTLYKGRCLDFARRVRRKANGIATFRV
jgi:mannose-6-phosphate isomerase-like protein (cupin superfamily)